ncbi:potassium channel family protein [Sulfurimonas sp. C5]|uniref:potassium channel family protein n=1 Tax=Sulfurimonas sp. C5 TaxID=3036947 RepID=UPI0024548402|nr:potassium channel family protein [Sulfurimonas sp. C5]MDH4943823.1 potassium channel family protein [Sulfurimonas sp. C5]
MKLVKYILSPTLALAVGLKSIFDKTNTIKTLNSIYLGIALISATLLAMFNITRDVLINDVGLILLILWGYFLMSRNNEIFIAFLNDAFDKLNNSINNTSLSISDRITLSLKSYLELIINFAIIYFLLPMEFWKDCNSPNNIESSIYFSGVTITTLGYGDISPSHWFPQFLTVYEVFCGFILLIVCFTIYTNMNSHKCSKCSKDL